MNLNTYVKNNPLKYSDPSGHEALPNIDWSQMYKESLKVIEGGAGGANKGKSGGWAGRALGGLLGILGSLVTNPNPVGKSQYDINVGFAQSIGISSLSVEEALEYKIRSDKNIVFRSINEIDKANLLTGKGITSKHMIPNREWTLLEHSTWGGPDSSGVDISIGFDPWISTTYDLDVAWKYNSGYGTVIIDLDLVNSEKRIPMYEFWGYNDYERELAHAYGLAEQEVSIYKYIPQNAIVGFIPWTK